MNLGKITGRVWATIKSEGLTRQKLLFLQPLSFSKQPIGDLIVALDTVDAGIGDTIIYVSSYEATIPFQPELVPTDATIVGVVERIDLIQDR